MRKINILTITLPVVIAMTYSNVSWSKEEVTFGQSPTISSDPASTVSGVTSEGVLRSLKTGSSELIISGTRYKYGVDLKVHSQDAGYANVYSLKKGQTLRFTYSEDRKGNRRLTEIWVVNASEYAGE